MQKFLDLENPVWRFMGKLVDMVLLTAIWAMCCLPVFTIGASTTALYYVTMKMASDIEGNIYSDFFRAFKSNFRQATVVWIIMSTLGLALAGSMWWYYRIDVPLAKAALPVLLIAAVLYLLVLAYLFPLLARCDVTFVQLFNMAFVMSIKNFGWTLFMIVCAVCVSAVGILIAAPILVIGAGLVAYIHGMILKVVFEQYGLNIK